MLLNSTPRGEIIVHGLVSPARPMDLTSTSFPSRVFRSCGLPQEVGHRKQGPERPNFRVRRDPLAIAPACRLLKMNWGSADAPLGEEVKCGHSGAMCSILHARRRRSGSSCTADVRGGFWLRR
jgi:hypothetical protein